MSASLQTDITFYTAALVAIISTVMVITRYNMIHALLYLVVSFLAVAVVFFLLGAPFIAALEIIIYAGAIVVLIIFVIMMLDLKEKPEEQERQWLTRRTLVGPVILAAVLMAELVYILTSLSGGGDAYRTTVGAANVGVALYGPYIIAVELAGLLLMAGVVGAYHLGRQKKKVFHRFLESKEE